MTHNQIEGILVMNRDMKPSVRPHNPSKLQQPRVCKIGDVREHGTTINQIEISVFERQMRRRRDCGEPERGAQIFIVYDRALISTPPNLASVRDVIKPSHHPPRPAAKVQHPVSVL